MTGFTVTIFLSSFLLFQVQPLIGRFIVPWFGGASSVWLTCVLFFQFALLVGYAYAHWLSRRFGPRAQGWMHLVVLSASLMLLPITPAAQGKPGPDQAPVGRIFLLLLFSVGGPYVVLASTGPLLQQWFARSSPGRSPYRLYALSNAAALLALVSYPVLIEPLLPLTGQAVGWSGVYAVFALVAAWRAVAVIVGARRATPVRDSGVRVPPRSVTLWLGLAASGSAMLLATTNQLTQEVASVPLLWVLPLSIYLLTFIICFDHGRWYQRRLFGPLLAVMAVLAVAFLVIGTRARLWTQVVVYSSVLFACCMTCHGELARSRPAPRHLTLFYLTVAAGGALGGSFVSLIAPNVFRGFWELHVALGFSCVLGLLAVSRDIRAGWYRRGLAVGVAGLSVALVLQARADRGDTIYAARNFYGAVRVAERRDALGAVRVLLNGRIAHGSQYLSSAERRRPVAYYDSASGVGMALRYAGHAARAQARGLHVGVVGLGVGALAAYGEPGDVFRFYEINPAVALIAHRFFTYLADSKARVEIALGDGRIQLENELRRAGSQQFDLLVIDAFSSDAIPAHLLTAECGALYLRHLKPDGLLLFHLSNRYVNLRPVIRGLASRLRLHGMWIVHGGRVRPGVLGSSWMILARPGNPIFEARELTDSASGFPTAWETVAKAGTRLGLGRAEIERRIYVGQLASMRDSTGVRVQVETDPPPILWTDDRQSLWRVLRFR
jgi:hypothetical protein